MFALLLTGTAARALAAAPSSPVHLRVEGLLEPVAVISEARPRFSYLHDGEPVRRSSFGITQASYRVTVADADARAVGAGPDATAQLLWDSGDVKSSNCSQIVYDGQALRPFSRYIWTVAWTSSAGETSATATSQFETGPMDVSDWQGAGWLESSAHNTTGVLRSQFRNEFSLPDSKKLAFARAYVAAAGCAHVEVNGRVPQPDLRGVCPWPVSTTSVRYVTHDVTSLLELGKKNALGMVVGNQVGTKMGWLPQAIVLLVVRYEGEAAPNFALSSGSSGWKARAPYVTQSTAWDAEIDWRMQEAGWSKAGFQPGAQWSARLSCPLPAASCHPLPQGVVPEFNCASADVQVSLRRARRRGRCAGRCRCVLLCGRFDWDFPRSVLVTKY
jgi:alpha-L-rhamnosidase